MVNSFSPSAAPSLIAHSRNCTPRGANSCASGLSCSVSAWQCEQTSEMNVSATTLPRYWLNGNGAASGRRIENGGGFRGACLGACAKPIAEHRNTYVTIRIIIYYRYGGLPHAQFRTAAPQPASPDPRWKLLEAARCRRAIPHRAPPGTHRARRQSAGGIAAPGGPSAGRYRDGSRPGGLGQGGLHAQPRGGRPARWFRRASLSHAHLRGHRASL